MKKWEVTVINETKDGYLCMSPNGDTIWITREDYIKYEKIKNVRKHKH